MKRRHRRLHQRIWTVLAVVLPLALLGSLAARRTGPADAPSIQIAPPQ